MLTPRDASKRTQRDLVWPQSRPLLSDFRAKALPHSATTLDDISPGTGTTFERRLAAQVVARRLLALS